MARKADTVNPFAGAVFYVNPDYAKFAATSLAKVAATSVDAKKIKTVQVGASRRAASQSPCCRLPRGTIASPELKGTPSSWQASQLAAAAKFARLS